MSRSSTSQTAEFWIINISKQNVSLADLALTVPAGKSINLLRKANNFTAEQIYNSVNSGSILKKSDKIKIRKVRPVRPEPKEIKVSTQPRIATARSTVEFKENKFEELLFSDEKLAEEFAELIDTK